MAASELEVEVAKADLARLRGEVSGFSSALQRFSRDRFREVLQDVADDMQSRVSSGAARFDVGLRQGIAAGIRVKDSPTGVEIEASTDGLPAAKAAMVAAYNQDSFRHPVYGGPGSASQSGRPYFGYTIDRRRHDVEQSQEQALADAAATVDTGKVTGN